MFADITISGILIIVSADAPHYTQPLCPSRNLTDTVCKQPVPTCMKLCVVNCCSMKENTRLPWSKKTQHVRGWTAADICTNCVYTIPAPRDGGPIPFFWQAGRRSLPHGWLCSSQKRWTSSQILARRQATDLWTTPVEHLLVRWRGLSAGVRGNGCWTPSPFFGGGPTTTTRLPYILDHARDKCDLVALTGTWLSLDVSKNASVVQVKIHFISRNAISVCGGEQNKLFGIVNSVLERGK